MTQAGPLFFSMVCLHPITTSNENHSTTCNFLRLTHKGHFWEWLPRTSYNRNWNLGSYWQSIATLRKSDWSVRYMESFLLVLSVLSLFCPPAPSIYFHRNIWQKIRESVPSNPAFLSFISWKWLERDSWFPESSCLGPVMALLLDGRERCCADISILFLFIRAKCWNH